MVGAKSNVSRIAGNAAWLVLAEVVGRFASFVVVITLARRLTQAGLGTVELGLGIFGMFQLVVIGGADVIATRRAARSVKTIATSGGAFLMVSWIIFALGAPLAGARAVFLPDGQRGPLLLFAAAVFLVPVGLRFAFQGRERMSVLAAGTILSQVTWLGGALLFVEDDSDLIWAGVVWVIAQAVRAALQFPLFIHWYGRPRFTHAHRRLRAWSAAVLPISVGRISSGAMFVIDILLLGSLSDDLSVVGVYAVALKLPLFMMGVGTMVHTALFPMIARRIPRDDPSTAGRLLADLIKLALSLTLPAIVALAMIRTPLISAFFGDGWTASTNLFALLLLRAPLSAVSGLLRLVIWSAEPRLDAKIGSVGFGFTLCAILVLTPLFGATGTAVAMVLGEAALVVLYARHSRHWVRFDSRGHFTWLLSVTLGTIAVFGWQLIAPPHPWATIAGPLVIATLAGLLPNVATLRQLIRRRNQPE